MCPSPLFALLLSVLPILPLAAATPVNWGHKIHPEQTTSPHNSLGIRGHTRLPPLTFRNGQHFRDGGPVYGIPGSPSNGCPPDTIFLPSLDPKASKTHGACYDKDGNRVHRNKGHYDDNIGGDPSSTSEMARLGSSRLPRLKIGTSRSIDLGRAFSAMDPIPELRPMEPEHNGRRMEDKMRKRGNLVGHAGHEGYYDNLGGNPPAAEMGRLGGSHFPRPRIAKSQSSDRGQAFSAMEPIPELRALEPENSARRMEEKKRKRGDLIGHGRDALGDRESQMHDISSTIAFDPTGRFDRTVGGRGPLKRCKTSIRCLAGMAGTEQDGSDCQCKPPDAVGAADGQELLTAGLANMAMGKRRR